MIKVTMEYSLNVGQQQGDVSTSTASFTASDVLEEKEIVPDVLASKEPTDGLMLKSLVLVFDDRLPS